MPASPFVAAAEHAAQTHGIPVSLFLRQVNAESGWNPRAVSPTGARGLLQLMPGTARGLGVTDVFDPIQNLNAGAKYLREQYDHFGNWTDALAAYNAGPGAVASGAWKSYPETTNYVHEILGGLGGESLATPSRSETSAHQTPNVGQQTEQPRGIAQPDLNILNALIAGNAPSPEQMLASIGSGPTTASASSSPSLPSATVKVGTTRIANVTADPVDLKAVNLVRTYLGTPYKWGGANPKTGFDCSGLVQFTYGQLGVNLPRTSQEQFQVGTPVSQNDLRPGDILFFVGYDGTETAPGHEGMYIGNGKFIEAPHTGTDVQISTLAGRTDYVGARRYA